MATTSCEGTGLTKDLEEEAGRPRMSVSRKSKDYGKHRHGAEPAKPGFLISLQSSEEAKPRETLGLQ